MQTSALQMVVSCDLFSGRRLWRISSDAGRLLHKEERGRRGSGSDCVASNRNGLQSLTEHCKEKDKGTDFALQNLNFPVEKNQ